jgi:hypothetical protein
MRETLSVPIIPFEFLLKLLIKCGVDVCADNKTKIHDADIS